MNYENFRAAIGREFAAWKQQQQQPQSGPLQSAAGLEEGTVLRSREGKEIRIKAVHADGSLNYHWKKDDGSWSNRTMAMGPGTFRSGQYERQEAPGSAEGPRAQVGDAIESFERLRVGDVFRRNSGRPARRVLSVTPTAVSAQRIDDQGNPIGDPRSFNIQQLRDHKVTEHGDSGPRVEIGRQIDDTDQLRAGDFIQNDRLSNGGMVRKIVEVLPNGDLKTQRVNVRSGQNQGEVQTTPRGWITREGEFSGYGQYERVADPAEGVEAQRQRERERQQQERQETDRRRREQEEVQNERPHIGVGDVLEHPRQLRVGDTFRNRLLESQNRYREVVEVKANGTVMARLMDRESGPIEGPTTLSARLFEQHGPYQRFLGPGAAISSPSDVGPGTYVKKGDTVYLVVHRTPTDIQVQDVHQGRGVGRPTKISKADLQGGEYSIAPTPRQTVTGLRVENFNDLRVGQVVRAMHHRTPKWVRVESIGPDKIKVHTLNAQTGDLEGEPEELTQKDIQQWANLVNTTDMPEALLPPLEEPSGGFAEAGEGPLVSNSQPGRYDAVRITVEGATDEQIKRLLGPYAEGKNPRHILADLAGAGGLANSLSSINISVSINRDGTTGTATVSGAGDHIAAMSRYIYFRPGGGTISNSHFKLAPTAPAAMGLKMFATQVAAARDAGFREIDVSAAGHGPWRDGEYNGYYVWPRFGYDGGFSSYTFSEMPESIQNDIRQINPDAPRNLRFLDVMMASEAARDWWKDHGSSSDLSFDTRRGSRNLDYLEKYVREVAKKKGDVGADRFLNRAAAKKDKKDGPPYEWYPTFGPEEEDISDSIWDAMGEETRKKNKTKARKKKAALNLVDLAADNEVFRKLLLTELSKENA